MDRERNGKCMDGILFEMTYWAAQQHIGPIYVGSEFYASRSGLYNGGGGGGERSNGTSMTPLDNAVMEVSSAYHDH